MFVLLPDGYEVMGAAIATMLSNVIVLLYFVSVYRKLRDETILEFPRRLERIEKSSMASLFSVGVPAALSLFLYDLTNIVINRLSAMHGDLHACYEAADMFVMMPGRQMEIGEKKIV